jgi:hypothetical protein
MTGAVALYVVMIPAVVLVLLGATALVVAILVGVRYLSRSRPGDRS